MNAAVVAVGGVSDSAAAVVHVHVSALGSSGWRVARPFLSKYA